MSGAYHVPHASLLEEQLSLLPRAPVPGPSLRSLRPPLEEPLCMLPAAARPCDRCLRRVGDRRPCARVTSVGFSFKLIKLQARLRGKTRGGAPHYQPADLRFDPPRYAHTKRKCSTGHPSVVVSTDYSVGALAGHPERAQAGGGHHQARALDDDDTPFSTRRSYHRNQAKLSLHPQIAVIQ